jgi:hypothetical protein
VKTAHEGLVETAMGIFRALSRVFALWLSELCRAVMRVYFHVLGEDLKIAVDHCLMALEPEYLAAHA